MFENIDKTRSLLLEHNKMSSARTRTRTARWEVERTNHQVTTSQRLTYCISVLRAVSTHSGITGGQPGRFNCSSCYCPCCDHTRQDGSIHVVCAVLFRSAMGNVYDENTNNTKIDEINVLIYWTTEVFVYYPIISEARSSLLNQTASCDLEKDRSK